MLFSAFPVTAEGSLAPLKPPPSSWYPDGCRRSGGGMAEESGQDSGVRIQHPGSCPLPLAVGE